MDMIFSAPLSESFIKTCETSRREMRALPGTIPIGNKSRSPAQAVANQLRVAVLVTLRGHQLLLVQSQIQYIITQSASNHRKIRERKESGREDIGRTGS
jgi:hypothetical protein